MIPPPLVAAARRAFAYTDVRCSALQNPNQLYRVHGQRFLVNKSGNPESLELQPKTFAL